MMGVRTPRSLVLALVTFALVAGGCSPRGSDYQYVRSRATGTYLKLPNSWDVEGVEGDEQIEFARVFDAVRVAKAEIRLHGNKPGGFVRVRALSDAERDVTSFATIRGELLPELDAGINSGEVEILESTDLRPGAGFRGQRLVYRLIDLESGRNLMISQTSIVDSRTTRVHFLAIGCTEECYERHKKQIETVADSLTVKET